MTTFQQINVHDAKERTLNEKIQLVDIRDERSFEADHVAGSFHLTNANVAKFMKEVHVNTSVFVICYHGNSSKGVAQYLCDQGYLDVYSVDGGFTDWRIVHQDDE
jgi:thiosulfate sulfurtransferase